MSYSGEVSIGTWIAGAGGAADGSTYYGVSPGFSAVLFRPQDSVGHACALISLLPPVILMMHLATFLARRTAQDLWLAGGQVICEVLNVVLKHILCQARPLSPVLNMPAESFGMPSAHSQFMGFFAGYVAVQMAHSQHIPCSERAARVLGTVVLALAVGYARFHLYYHSAAQVAGGLVLGGALGGIWFLLSRPLRHYGVFAWGLSLWPCRLLCVKDSDYDVRKEYEVYIKNTK